VKSLRSQLAQSTHFDLLDAARVRSVLKQMGRPDADTSTPAVAREIALREGAPLVIYAALSRLGTDYTVGIKLEQVGARPSLTKRTWTHTFAAREKAGLPDAFHDAAVWVRQMAGEVPSALESQDRAPSETTSSSWEALRLFAQANQLSASGHLNEATLVLEQAIRTDPEFAMAQARLADCLISLRREKEGYEAWKRAIALADRHQVTSRETLRIRGQYADDTGDLATALKDYRTYAVHYPNDFHAAFFMGTTLMELDRVAEAVPWLETALARRPRSLFAAVHLTRAYLDLKRSSDAALMYPRIESLGEAEWSTWLRALAVFITGDIDEALKALAPLASSGDAEWRSRAFTLRASWLAERGSQRSSPRGTATGR
jgi:predicted Zn-dependent protease